MSANSRLLLVDTGDCTASVLLESLQSREFRGVRRFQTHALMEQCLQDILDIELVVQLGVWQPDRHGQL